MCGFAGAVGLHKGTDSWNQTLHAMADTLVHRGPDDSGTWFDPEVGIGMAHRRLAVVDLSAEGHQPMRSPCGRYVLVLNGEIYNYLELRKSLEKEGHSFRGGSDTEVLLALLARDGVHDGLGFCVGMFAFALWDKEERSLTLGRDRLGEKPLYYGWQGETFLFASELRAMRVHPSWRGDIDRDALTLLLRHNYIPAPHSIYRGIRKVEPGMLVRLSVPSGSGAHIEEIPYWSVREAVETGQRRPFCGTDAEAVDELERLLNQSISEQMLADVPVGAFLSGGVDSSAIVALMQAQSAKPVRTFTIGFEQPEFDESHHAQAVARHLGTDHVCLRVGSQQALDVVPQLASLYDEPFSDSSQIPTFLVSKLARESVTVSLSGDGGDETFCGYPRFTRASQLWDGLDRVPRAVRASARLAINKLPSSFWRHFFDAPFMPDAVRRRRLGDKIHSLSELLGASSREQLYRKLVSHWMDTKPAVLGGIEPESALTRPSSWPRQAHNLDRMMYLDMVSYLPGDILTKVDRAAMAVSLETRVPILDHRVIEFSWSLPLSLKVRDGSSKWILRRLLYKHVPRKLIERPKVGFGVPLGDWLRGPLREWAEHQLSQNRLESEGFFDAPMVREKWQSHLSGTANWHAWLWNILMFQAWHEKWH